MKILQIIDKLDIGGAERVFVDMCNILQEHQQDVTAMLLLENKGELVSELKVRLISLNRKNKWSLNTMYRCSKIIKKYDVIHCHFRHVYRYIALVKKIFFIKSKIILHDHYGSIDIDKSVPFLFDSFLKPDYYIGVSKSLTEWAETKLKVAPENIFLLENIIIQHKSKQQLAERYDLILVSNIKKVKNNLFGVKIAAQINKSLLLVGQNQDNTYFQKTKSEIKTDNIVINSDITEVQTILHNAQLGLHTSISETGPLVLIEYLAQGLPFLAYETGEVAKILKPHFPEYFIDNFNIEEWKKRLELIMNSVPDTQKMEEVFERYFGQTQYYKKLENIYRCISG
jgi:glycosyltransferase involved in cell wall biosynthesis